MVSMTPVEDQVRARHVASPLELALLGLACGLGCARGVAPYPPEAPLWRDPDRQPFAAQLEPAFSPKRWDAVDKSLLRPVSEFFAMRPEGESINVNAFDEVPDSSWFENRALRGLTPEAAALGPCPDVALSAEGPWLIKSAKPDGADPGFVIKAPDGSRYLVKLDEPVQSVRTSAADVVGSRIYHAAGFDTPCNTIVVFEPSILHIAPGAHAETDTGEEIAFSEEDLRKVLARAERGPSGRYRGVASLYLSGRPLGPWTYEGIRRDDRNDVVAHEDRRELRGSRLLAAWTDHSDQRDQNTLAMWIESGDGRGYVRHHLLDFGDCFGSLWVGPAEQTWRREHAYWFEPGQILVDFSTFGALERPWDRAKLGPSGLVFGYYAVPGFDPEGWRPTYPNPAFSRMSERDAAWMARILARLSEPHIEAIVRTAELEPELHGELVRTLVGRRRVILERYLTRLSPLSDPVVITRGGEPWLCLRDWAVSSKIASGRRRYVVRASFGGRQDPAQPLALAASTPGEACIALRQLSTLEPAGGYWSLRVAALDDAAPGAARRGRHAPYPLDVHVYDQGSGRFLLAALERPAFD